MLNQSKCIFTEKINIPTKTGITMRYQIPKRKEFLVENNRLNRFNALFLLPLSAILLHSSKNVSL
jgi:hypothetical protein